MMYSEFVEGTGCKQTEFNYNVFLKLERIYMDSDLTKEEIYTIGKMRVDNSETEAEREAREMVEMTINQFKADIDSIRERIKLKEESIEYMKMDKEFWKDELKIARRSIRNMKEELRETKMRFEAYKHYML